MRRETFEHTRTTRGILKKNYYFYISVFESRVRDRVIERKNVKRQVLRHNSSPRARLRLG